MPNPTPAPSTRDLATDTLPTTPRELHQLVTNLANGPIHARDAATLTRASLRLHDTADGLLTHDQIDASLASFVQVFAATPTLTTITSEELQAWCARGASPEEQHHRRATCSVALLALIEHGLLPVKTNPLSGIALAPLRASTGEGWDTVRPLTPLELLATRLATRVGRAPGPRAAMVAVSECGAATSELAALLAPGLRFWATRHIALPGHTKIAPRTVLTDGWRTRAIDAHIEDEFDAQIINDPRRHVFYSGDQSGTSNAAQASSSGVLLNILKIAGLGQDKNIKPHSIRFGGVRTRLHGTPEAHPVQAAKALGLSITASMRYLGLSL